MRKIQRFTLIELLVVISIISLLIAILLPALGAARRASRSVSCMSHLHQLGIAALTYSADFNDTALPAFPKYTQRALSHTPAGSGSWAGALRFYVGLPSQMGFYKTGDGPIFVCPEDDVRFGYGHNLDGMGWGTTAGDAVKGFVRNSDLPSPGKMVHLVDSFWQSSPNPSNWSQSWICFVRWPGSALTDSIVSKRHPNESANFLFADGHSVNNYELASDTIDKDPYWVQSY